MKSKKVFLKGMGKKKVAKEKNTGHQHHIKMMSIMNANEGVQVIVEVVMEVIAAMGIMEDQVYGLLAKLPRILLEFIDFKTTLNSTSQKL